MAPPKEDILTAFGLDPRALIGEGAQSRVYALDGERILRVYKKPADVAVLARTQALLGAIDARLTVPTATIEAIDPAGRFTVERRLGGTSLLRRLPALAGEQRQAAIRNFVAAADAAGAVSLTGQPYGHVLAATPIQDETWTGFMRRSLARAVEANGVAIAAEIGDVAALTNKALALLDAVPQEPAKALVHGDYFPGNVLMDDSLAITGLVDFSVYTMAGDPQYDTITAPIFLEMAEGISADDIATAREAARAKLGDAMPPAARFYRAHAAFAMANPTYAAPPYPRLYPWALATLRRLAEDDLAD